VNYLNFLKGLKKKKRTWGRGRGVYVPRSSWLLTGDQATINLEKLRKGEKKLENSTTSSQDIAIGVGKIEKREKIPDFAARKEGGK